MSLFDMTGQVAAINRSQAVIEFALDGTILTANENFLKTMGYDLDQVHGRHHSMFVEPGYRESTQYKRFLGCPLKTSDAVAARSSVRTRGSATF